MQQPVNNLLLTEINEFKNMSNNLTNHSDISVANHQNQQKESCPKTLLSVKFSSRLTMSSQCGMKSMI